MMTITVQRKPEENGKYTVSIAAEGWEHLSLTLHAPSCYLLTLRRKIPRPFSMRFTGNGKPDREFVCKGGAR